MSISVDLEWSPVAILPNIAVAGPTGNALVQIVPSSDARIVNLGRDKPNLAAFAARFSDQAGRSVEPSWVIMHRAFERRHNDGDALVAFRDSFAISCCLNSWQRNLNGKSNLGLTGHSDSFDFYPYMLDMDLDSLLVRTFHVAGFNSVRNFLGQTSPQVAHTSLNPAFMDNFLFSALMDFWSRVYVSKRSSANQRRLFRALQMAYHALRVPSGYYTSDLDLGRLGALWVSACEILVHDGKRASFSHVLKALDEVDYIDVGLTKKRYSWSTKKRREKVNAAQKAYKMMHDARNAFLHGNPIKKSTLSPRVFPRSVYHACPIVFRFLLEAKLRTWAQKRLTGSIEDMVEQASRNHRALADQGAFEDAILGLR